MMEMLLHNMDVIGKRTTLVTGICDKNPKCTKNWRTENKLQLNEDKTETRLFNFSKLNIPLHLFPFICKATIFFSDSVRKFSFYLDKDLSMKGHMNYICKTCFPGNPTY